ncbi:polysaccharide biosynthesis/export family protein [Tropicimonas sp.]|uniref:polysaccharide biosynthesis/export family protein n=1 Tax=Tropicimonas sp. TaxID=2067044 RepID=UPI003A869957
MLKLIRLLLPMLVLGACALPRGAPIEREVLAVGPNEERDFAVYAVTRDTLPGLTDWPATDNVRRFGWISGQSDSPGVIQPYDTLQMVIWDSEENSLLTAQMEKQATVPALRVTQGGTVFVPYVGKVHVAGKTADAAREQIERELLASVPSAQVQLSVVPGPRGSVSLIGGVRNPGTVPLPEGNFTVLSLISQGGGPASLNNPQVRLIRGGKTYGTSLDHLIDNPSQDPSLRGGDKVALVDDERFFRAFGAAGKEQIVRFTEDKLSAMDAVSLMGGLDERSANPQGILLLREYPRSAVRSDGRGPMHERTIFALDLTSADGIFSANRMPIYSGDTLMVTESPVNSTRTIFGLAGTLIGFNTQFSQ